MSEAPQPAGTVEIVRERDATHAVIAPLKLRVIGVSELARRAIPRPRRHANCNAAEVPTRDLSDIDLTHEDLKTARERWVRTFEREYLVRLLEANDGNASAAARNAGVDRKYLYRLLWRHGLR